MKQRLFTIPNIITLSSLVCGVLASVQVLLYAEYRTAFLLVLLAAVFDFLDGFVARALGQTSPMGVELDSLCDLVSFGLVPTFVLLSLGMGAHSSFVVGCAAKWMPYTALLVASASALRLARFNVEQSSHGAFIGLPTPANALLCLSVGLLHQDLGLSLSVEALAIISAVVSFLLISPIEMFTLKFKSFSFKENRTRYIFLALAAIELVALKLYAMPAIIVTYIGMSIIVDIATRVKLDKKGCV